MKIKTIVSSLVLFSVLGTVTVKAEDTPLPEEKGLIGSMVDAVKGTASDVKKAVTKKEDNETAPAADAPVADAPVADAPVADAPVAETPTADAPTADAPTADAPTANAPVTDAVEEKDDSKDADVGRTVSDTSIAVTAQNDYVQSIMKKVQHITATEAKKKMSEVDNIIVVDIRSASEFSKQKSITEAAINIPRTTLEMDAFAKLDNKDSFIFVVSSKGIGGALAANTMQDMGYKNVYNLLGGLEGWNK